MLSIDTGSLHDALGQGLHGQERPVSTNGAGALKRFAAAAETFCDLVDHHATYADRAAWLRQIGETLKQLDDDIKPLNGRTAEAEYSMLQNLEERFVLFGRLKTYLGALDEYWSEADLEAGDGLKTGSLADDIADLYFDLKRGLTIYCMSDSTGDNAIDLWLYSYKIHWQQHLRDATKQLFEFRRLS